MKNFIIRLNTSRLKRRNAIVHYLFKKMKYRRYFKKRYNVFPPSLVSFPTYDMTSKTYFKFKKTLQDLKNYINSIRAKLLPYYAKRLKKYKLFVKKKIGTEVFEINQQKKRFINKREERNIIKGLIRLKKKNNLRKIRRLIKYILPLFYFYRRKTAISKSIKKDELVTANYITKDFYYYIKTITPKPKHKINFESYKINLNERLQKKKLKRKKSYRIIRKLFGRQILGRRLNLRYRGFYLAFRRKRKIIKTSFQNFKKIKIPSSLITNRTEKHLIPFQSYRNRRLIWWKYKKERKKKLKLRSRLIRLFGLHLRKYLRGKRKPKFKKWFRRKTKWISDIEKFRNRKLLKKKKKKKLWKKGFKGRMRKGHFKKELKNLKRATRAYLPRRYLPFPIFIDNKRKPRKKKFTQSGKKFALKFLKLVPFYTKIKRGPYYLRKRYLRNIFRFERTQFAKIVDAKNSKAELKKNKKKVGDIYKKISKSKAFDSTQLFWANFLNQIPKKIKRKRFDFSKKAEELNKRKLRLKRSFIAEKLLSSEHRRIKEIIGENFPYNKSLILFKINIGCLVKHPISRKVIKSPVFYNNLIANKIILDFNLLKVTSIKNKKIKQGNPGLVIFFKQIYEPKLNTIYILKLLLKKGLKIFLNLFLKEANKTNVKLLKFLLLSVNNLFLIKRRLDVCTNQLKWKKFLLNKQTNIKEFIRFGIEKKKYQLRQKNYTTATIFFNSILDSYNKTKEIEKLMFESIHTGIFSSFLIKLYNTNGILFEKLFGQNGDFILFKYLDQYFPLQKYNKPTIVGKAYKKNINNFITTSNFLDSWIYFKKLENDPKSIGQFSNKFPLVMTPKKKIKLKFLTHSLIYLIQMFRERHINRLLKYKKRKRIRQKYVHLKSLLFRIMFRQS